MICTGDRARPPHSIVIFDAASKVIIDQGVNDYQSLVEGVVPGSEIHVLDSTQDAITQITNTLLGRTGIESLQIISHGEMGGLDFAQGSLNLGNLPQYAAQLQSWKASLSDDADNGTRPPGSLASPSAPPTSRRSPPPDCLGFEVSLGTFWQAAPGTHRYQGALSGDSGRSPSPTPVTRSGTTLRAHPTSPH